MGGRNRVRVRVRVSASLGAPELEAGVARGGDGHLVCRVDVVVRVHRTAHARATPKLRHWQANSEPVHVGPTRIGGQAGYWG